MPKAERRASRDASEFRPAASARDAAVDNERMSGDEGGVVAGEIQSGARDVLGQTRSRDRLQFCQPHFHDLDSLVRHLRRKAQGLAEDRGGDAAGANAVHPHAAFAEFLCDRPREMNHRCFRRAVNVRSHAGINAGDRRGGDDRAGLLLAHHAPGVLDPEHDSPEQNAEGGLGFDERRLEYGAANPGEPGVVEHAVDLAVSLDRVSDNSLEITLFRDVRAEIGDCRSQVLDQPGPFIVLDVGDDDRSPLPNEKLHGAAAYAARAPGDDCDFAGQPAHGRHSLIVVARRSNVAIARASTLNHFHRRRKIDWMALPNRCAPRLLASVAASL